MAVADSYSTSEDTPLNVPAPGVLANDSDDDGDALTAVLVNDVSNGNLTLNANGGFSYTPDANFNGPDSFTYKANDGTDDSNTVTVSISVSEDNDPPVAVANSYSTDEDTTLNVPAPGVLGNDSDPDGDTLTAVLETGVSNGTLNLSANGGFSYNPKTNFNGPDSFTYKANDGDEDSNTVTVSISVSEDNDPPVANDDTASTPEDTPVTVDVLANDDDLDGDQLTVFSVTNGNYGDVSNNGSNVTYSPQSNFNGPDTFFYTASDGDRTNTAEVRITVQAVNDRPEANNDTASTAEDTAVIIDVLANDTDVDNDELRVSAVTGSDDGSVVINNGSLDVTYTPDTGFNGTNTFTYTASDGSATDTAKVTVTVTGDFFVQTEDVTEIGETSATGNVDIIKLGEPQPTRVGICWSDEEMPTINDSTNDIDPPFATGLFSLPISNLVPGTIYYVRAFARDRNRTPVYGSQKQFTSLIEPVVNTLPVSRIGDTVATANGSITDLGEPSPDDHGFCWSTDPNPTVDDADDSVKALGTYSGSVPYSFNYKMTGLLPETTYYVRAYATNAVGTVYGDDDFFITDPLSSKRAGGKDSYWYSGCFIETTRSEGGQWNPTKWIGLFFLAVVSVCFLNRFLRRRLGALTVVMAILLGVSLFASNSYAAEGAAAGAPPQAESTESVPAVGVPTPLEEEKSTLEQLKKLEKREDEYTPVAVSSAETVSSQEKKKTMVFACRSWLSHLSDRRLRPPMKASPLPMKSTTLFILS